jgi:hypothetical protein
MPTRRFILILLLLAVPNLAHAQDFTYTTNDGAIAITGYTGPGGALSIPPTITGLPVTTIGPSAFSGCVSLTSLTFPNTITNIGSNAFRFCTSVASVALPNSVRTIGDWAFYGQFSLPSVIMPDSVTAMGAGAFSFCTALTNVTISRRLTTLQPWAFSECDSLANITIPDSVTSMGSGAFYLCINLTTVTIPSSVTFIGPSAFNSCYSLSSLTLPHSLTEIGTYAFGECSSLSNLCFQGNAPRLGADVLWHSPSVIVCYRPGTIGWSSTFAGRPTAPWYLPNPTILNFGPDFGLQAKRFGFRISWATNASVPIDACTNLAAPTWAPVATNTIAMGSDPLTDGWSYFSDPDWTNHPARFYRVR